MHFLVSTGGQEIKETTAGASWPCQDAGNLGVLQLKIFFTNHGGADNKKRVSFYMTCSSKLLKQLSTPLRRHRLAPYCAVHDLVVYFANKFVLDPKKGFGWNEF